MNDTSDSSNEKEIIQEMIDEVYSSLSHEEKLQIAEEKLSSFHLAQGEDFVVGLMKKCVKYKLNHKLN